MYPPLDVCTKASVPRRFSGYRSAGMRHQVASSKYTGPSSRRKPLRSVFATPASARRRTSLHIRGFVTRFASGAVDPAGSPQSGPGPSCRDSIDSNERPFASVHSIIPSTVFLAQSRFVNAAIKWRREAGAGISQLSEHPDRLSDKIHILGEAAIVPISRVADRSPKIDTSPSTNRGPTRLTTRPVPFRSPNIALKAGRRPRYRPGAVRLQRHGSVIRNPGSAARFNAP